jgi:hypothetical protein
MSNIVPEISLFRSGSVSTTRAQGRRSSQWTETMVDTLRIAELIKTTSGSATEHPWSTMAPECPVLTQARNVNRLCDSRGVFRAGQLAPTAR